MYFVFADRLFQMPMNIFNPHLCLERLMCQCHQRNFWVSISASLSIKPQVILTKSKQIVLIFVFSNASFLIAATIVACEAQCHLQQKGICRVQKCALAVGSHRLKANTMPRALENSQGCGTGCMTLTSTKLYISSVGTLVGLHMCSVGQYGRHVLSRCWIMIRISWQ